MPVPSSRPKTVQRLKSLILLSNHISRSPHHSLITYCVNKTCYLLYLSYLSYPELDALAVPQFFRVTLGAGPEL